MSLLALAVSGRGVVPLDEPAIHADDEGFLRGRAAFETMRVYAGRPFRLAEHLARLSASAARIGLETVNERECEALAAAAIAQAGAGDCSLRLYWTAGREGRHEPICIALVSEIPPHLDALRERGVRLASLQLGVDAELRAASPWLLGGVKSTSYAVNMASEAEAKRRGADDALFLGRADIVLEGPVWNVWWRVGRTLFTPALELGILAGVTRAAVLDAASSCGYAVEQGVYPLAALAAAEEAFTSSSVRELVPVVELDGAPLGDGRPGEAVRALHVALRREALG